MLTLINPIVRHEPHKFKLPKTQSLQTNRIKMPLQRDTSVPNSGSFLLWTGIPPILPDGK